MTVLYIDCFAGVSGDMFVGALLDLGADFNKLKEGLDSLSLDNYRLETKNVLKNGLMGVKFTVNVDGHPHKHRHLRHIMEIIGSSRLSPFVRARAIEVFTRLAEAEAKIHGISSQDVHFHEVGAVDSIVDVIGTLLCIEQLGISKIVSSPVPPGSGFAKCQHGIIPVPAPATLELLKGVPLSGCFIEGEAVTPTGAALLVALAERFDSLPPIKTVKIGYGAGAADRKVPNLLRLILGQEVPDYKSPEQVCVVSATIDDMNPELYDFAMNKLFTAGALDVSVSPLSMKKNRPGQLVTVLCQKTALDNVVDTLFEHTTTLGVRVREEARFLLDREFQTVETPWGSVKVKIGKCPQSCRRLTVSPEWEDCRKAAEENNVSAKVVYDYAKAVIMQEVFSDKKEELS